MLVRKFRVGNSSKAFSVFAISGVVLARIFKEYHAREDETRCQNEIISPFRGLYPPKHE